MRDLSLIESVFFSLWNLFTQIKYDFYNCLENKKLIEQIPQDFKE